MKSKTTLVVLMILALSVAPALAKKKPVFTGTLTGPALTIDYTITSKSTKKFCLASVATGATDNLDAVDLKANGATFFDLRPGSSHCESDKKFATALTKSKTVKGVGSDGYSDFPVVKGTLKKK